MNKNEIITAALNKIANETAFTFRNHKSITFAQFAKVDDTIAYVKDAPELIEDVEDEAEAIEWWKDRVKDKCDRSQYGDPSKYSYEDVERILNTKA